MNIRTTNIALVTLLLFLLSITPGCKEDELPPEVTIQGSELIIANEGNFGWGEGTISTYDPDSKTVQNEVYKSGNGSSLGNVLHSISSINGQYFFVVNNSGKVVITDTHFIEQAEITDLTSPRNIYRINDSKVYITDLYADAISVLNIHTLEVVKKIPTNGHSEEGVVLNGTFWFCGVETQSIYAVDIETDEIKDSIVVGGMPENIILDKDNRLWVLSRGDQENADPAKLSVVDLGLGDTSILAITLNGVPRNLAYDQNSDVLYFLQEGIWRLDLASGNLEPDLWRAEDNKVFYAMEVNPENSDVYVSDVKDFVSRSEVYRYSVDGIEIDHFTTGIITGDFFFP